MGLLFTVFASLRKPELKITKSGLKAQKFGLGQTLQPMIEDFHGTEEYRTETTPIFFAFKFPEWYYCSF